jgi:hypothetical protein
MATDSPFIQPDDNALKVPRLRADALYFEAIPNEDDSVLLVMSKAEIPGLAEGVAIFVPLDWERLRFLKEKIDQVENKLISEGL